MKRLESALPLFLLLFALTLAVFSCVSQNRSDKTNLVLDVPIEGPLHLIFAGDIMAHNVNFQMHNYNDIYQDVKALLVSDDVTFGNLEMPVADNLPMSTYPRFNVHSSYVKAAIDGGFDVFSLANNHSNDQGLSGIAGTLTAMKFLSPRGFSGLRASDDVPETMVPSIIEVRGWRILYLSVTEILNSFDSSRKGVYYVGVSQAERMSFLESLSNMRKEFPCDIFILSLHSNESEYVTTVPQIKRDWFTQLSLAGVDIVWAHHSHVMQEWDHQYNETLKREYVHMYSMGNFVSGQRYTADTSSPSSYREYTGDAVLLSLYCERDSSNPSLIRYSIKNHPITVWKDSSKGMVVKHFNSSFVRSLPPVWQAYYRSRYELMRSYLPLLPLEEQPAILK